MTPQPKAKHRDAPISDAVVARFMAAYPWMASSRHPRDRLAFRIVEWQADQISQLKMKLAGEAVQEKGPWEQKVAGK
jgi:hypothetical protein